jgi:hypothetical protein
MDGQMISGEIVMAIGTADLIALIFGAFNLLRLASSPRARLCDQ